MEVIWKSPSNMKEMVVLLVVVLFFFPLESVAIKPNPFCFVSLELAEPPLPVQPYVSKIPQQDAQANSDFKLNLQTFVSESPLAFSYRVTNYSRDMPGETAEMTATSLGIYGLPKGLIQSRRGAGDCSTAFRLLSGQSCLLYFYVDKNKFTSLDGGSGPVVSTHLSWFWGSHKNHGDGRNLTSFPQQSIANVLGPVLLPTQIDVTPKEQNGLYYNPATSSIEGVPMRTGAYDFMVSAHNDNLMAEPQALTILVSANSHDTPVFIDHYNLASAMPGREYRVNLIDLIEPVPGFAVGNQVRFRIDLDRSHPSWLSLDKASSTWLHGHVPSTEAGQINDVTLIATSNTGGDSLPLTIRIPVALDPEKRPVFDRGIELSGRAGLGFQHDFRTNIHDPSSDSRLRLILDKIEPQAPWLFISASNLTELEGNVPDDAVGQTYQLIVHVNSSVGGDSAPVTIPLRIAIDETKTPRFVSSSPQLPEAYVGLRYVYRFVDRHDVEPQYMDIPYVVELARHHGNPAWLRIENNELIADHVPNDVEQRLRIYITMKNIPGGKSAVLSLDLGVIGETLYAP